MRTILPDQYSIQDHLSFEDYKMVLSKIIISSETPIAIGVFGSWGSGKTSLLRMLQEDIKKQKKYNSVWFNAWKYEEQEVLWRTLVLCVLDSLRPRTKQGNLIAEVSLKKWQKEMMIDLDRLEENLYQTVEWKEIGQWVVDWAKAVPSTIDAAAQVALSFTPAGKPLIDLLELVYKGVTGKSVPGVSESFQQKVKEFRREQLKSIEQFEGAFQKLVDKYVVSRGGRLVVFIDDLDRCLPEKSIQVLEAIKLFLDVPGCVFVLAIDKDIIEKGIESRYQKFGKETSSALNSITGDSFLEKIIQIPFHLPPIDKREAIQFIHELSKDFPANPAEVFSLGLLTNPRKIKRVMNIFWMLKDIAEIRTVRKKLNIQINDTLLAKLIVIQTRIPALYKEIVEFPSILQQLEDYFRNTALLSGQSGFSTKQETNEKDNLTNSNQITISGFSENWGKYLIDPGFAFLSKIFQVGNDINDFFGGLKISQIEEYIFLVGSASEEKLLDRDGDQQFLSILLSGDFFKIKDVCMKLKQNDQDKYYVSILEQYCNDTNNIKKSFSAGIALGYLGIPVDVEDLILIPEGEFKIREKEIEKNIILPSYMVGKYPVTNSLFKIFIEAGGYKDRSFWTEKGWLVKERENWQQPLFWGDPKFNNPNQPVVGVSWYEATAYANWKGCNLLTSEQWERTASGLEQRLYPWGNDFDIRCANTVETGVQMPSPVHLWVKGVSPAGTYDMAGNVWEWTCQEHPLGGIVLRGGSWNDESKYATTIYQFRDDPHKRFDNVGFRIGK